MSLITVLESAIVARAQSDGTLVSLLGGSGAPRFTMQWGSLTLPGAFVVCRAEATVPQDSFDKRVREFTVDFHIFDATDNGNTNAQAIIVRLMGDWPAQTDRVPTFGFDRWKPDLSSAGWSTGGMFVSDEQTAHEKDELCYIVRMRGVAGFL